MDDEDLHKVADLKWVGTWKQIKNGRTSWEEGRYVTIPVGHMMAVMASSKKSNALAAKEGKPLNYKGDREEIKGSKDNNNFFNENPIRKGETISAACQASARGLAKLAQLMANKGSLNGQHLMSEEAWEEMHSESKEEIECPFG